MKSSISRILKRSITVAGAVWMAVRAAAGSELSEWPKRFPVSVPSRGLNQLALSNEMLDASRPDLGDLRLADPFEREIPYLIQRPAPKPRESRAVKSFKTTLSGGKTMVLIETGQEAAVDAIQLAVPDVSFIKGVSLEGSRDGVKFDPLAESAPIFRQMGAEELTLRFQSGLWRWIRLTVDDQRTPPVAIVGARVWAAASDETSTEALSATIRSREELEGESRLVVDLGAANLSVAAIDIDARDPYFQREVSIRSFSLNGEVLMESELGRGVIYSVGGDAKPGARRVTMTLDRVVPSRELVLSIRNGDSPPLDVSAVRVSRRPIHLLFSASDPGAYQLYAGNAQSPAPRYDLAAFAGDLGPSDATAAAAGATEANPKYKRADPLPGLEETGGSFDDGEWRYRKIWSLARPGVQQLELDLETLSRSQDDLSDLRIVQGGFQIPYIIQRPSLVRAETVAANASRDPGEKRISRWEIKLPQPNLPILRIDCSSRTAVFQRDLVLWEEASDERGASYRRELGRTHWQRTTQRDSSKCVIPLDARPRGSRLFLEADNGDNSPLELDLFKAVYPVTRLIFKAPEASFIYYGNPKAVAPRYDVALVAGSLIASEKSPATLGREESLKPSRWTEGETLKGGKALIFWAALTAVVGGLVAVIAHLLPKSPAIPHDKS